MKQPGRPHIRPAMTTDQLKKVIAAHALTPKEVRFALQCSPSHLHSLLNGSPISLAYKKRLLNKYPTIL